MDEKLKPCPFCSFEEICIHSVDGGFEIHCENCNVRKDAPTVLGGRSGKTYLIEFWNTRA